MKTTIIEKARRSSCCVSRVVRDNGRVEHLLTFSLTNSDIWLICRECVPCFPSRSFVAVELVSWLFTSGSFRSREFVLRSLTHACNITNPSACFIAVTVSSYFVLLFARLDVDRDLIRNPILVVLFITLASKFHALTFYK